MHTYGRQARILALLVAVYAAAAAAYTLLPENLAAARAALPGATATQFAFANLGMVVLFYFPLGLLGLWLARRLGLPGIVRAEDGAGRAFGRPLALGLGLGAILMAIDLTAQRLTGMPGFSHPPFPASILASISAAIGEEILFRLLAMSLWGLFLTWLLGRLRRGHDSRNLALWLANGLAALAFAASHLTTAMVLYNAASPAELPPTVLALILVLNTLIALPAGEQFRRHGLVAAIGVHLGADLTWHVAYGLLAAALL